MVNLYKNSQLYLFTSYSEVFGFTSLEAMSQRCPVLISDTSALSEINNDAVEYFDPDNILEIKEKIKKILIDKKYKINLAQKGETHFKKFTWDINTKKTLEVINDLN